jgi:hypothetical protein
MLKRSGEYRETEIPWLQEMPAHWHSLRAKTDSYVNQIEDNIVLLSEYCPRLISDVVAGKVNVQNVRTPNYTPEILNDELENGILEEEDLNDQ